MSFSMRVFALVVFCLALVSGCYKPAATENTGGSGTVPVQGGPGDKGVHKDKKKPPDIPPFP
jgi:hypothetical protein